MGGWTVLTGSVEDDPERKCGGLSFDQIFSANEKRQRYFEPKRLGGLEVDDQFDFGGLLDGKVGWLRAFEDRST